MIELVPMAYRIVNEVDAAQANSDYRIAVPTDKKDASGSLSGKSAASGVAGTNATNPGSTSGKKMDEDEERDAVFYRLESLGYRVGQGLVERYA